MMNKVNRTKVRGERSNPVITRGINEMDSIEEILFEAYNKNKLISRLEAYTMAYNEIIEDTL